MAQNLRHKRLDIGERKFLLNGLVDSIDEEIDMIRSMDGAYATTSSTSVAQVITAKTSPNRTFHVKTITVTTASSANKVTFYSDAAGAVPIVAYRLTATDTYTVTDIAGMAVTQLYFAATTASVVEVWVGGVWRLT